MKSNTTTATTYAVSEQTAAYIGCKKELNALFESISKALMLHYGEAFEDVLEADFLPAFSSLGGVIDGFIAGSIDEQLGIVCNNGKMI